MIRKKCDFPLKFLLVLMVCGCVAPPGPDPAAPAPPTSAEAGGQTIVAIAAPSPPQQTLPQWLGINDMFGAIGGLTRVKHRFLAPLFPQLSRQMLLNEPPPLLKSITDPDNLKEDAPPVVQAAAEAQMDEEKAEQKIAAIEALAKIGCVRGHPAVEDGLLASLSDPTERVRFAAVTALAELAGSPCEICQSGSCCSPKIYAKLAELADKKKTPTCWYEPSGRVRRLARRAMIACGPSSLPKSNKPKIEGPPDGVTPAKPKVEGPETPPPPAVQNGGPTLATEGSGNSIPPLTTIPKRKSDSVTSANGSSNKTDARTISMKSTGNNSPSEKSTLASDTGSNGDERSIRIRWEHVSAPITNYSSRARALAAIQYLRDRALGVRSRRPNDWNHKQFVIRVHGWTAEETIRPVGLSRLVSRLPVGRVSVIVEDRTGFHMVRVLERRTPTAPRPESNATANVTPREQPDRAWKLNDPRVPLSNVDASARPVESSKLPTETESREVIRTRATDTTNAIRRSAATGLRKPATRRSENTSELPQWNLDKSESKKAEPRTYRPPVAKRTPKNVTRRFPLPADPRSEKTVSGVHGRNIRHTRTVAPRQTSPATSHRDVSRSDVRQRIETRYDETKQGTVSDGTRRESSRPESYRDSRRNELPDAFPLRRSKPIVTPSKPENVPTWKLDSLETRSRQTSPADKRRAQLATTPAKSSIVRVDHSRRRPHPGMQARPAEYQRPATRQLPMRFPGGAPEQLPQTAGRAKETLAQRRERERLNLGPDFVWKSNDGCARCVVRPNDPKTSTLKKQAEPPVEAHGIFKFGQWSKDNPSGARSDRRGTQPVDRISSRTR